MPETVGLSPRPNDLPSRTCWSKSCSSWSSCSMSWLSRFSRSLESSAAIAGRWRTFEKRWNSRRRRCGCEMSSATWRRKLVAITDSAPSSRPRHSATAASHRGCVYALHSSGSMPSNALNAWSYSRLCSLRSCSDSRRRSSSMVVRWPRICSSRTINERTNSSLWGPPFHWFEAWPAQTVAVDKFTNESHRSQSWIPLRRLALSTVKGPRQMSSCPRRCCTYCPTSEPNTSSKWAIRFSGYVLPLDVRFQTVSITSFVWSTNSSIRSQSIPPVAAPPLCCSEQRACTSSLHLPRSASNASFTPRTMSMSIVRPE
mmetsp:Transcript_98919/g.282913  ORF Transcript_98919/g.282913 Transcript_98919/m.282913 type:complete len:314 (+) Transcript_98919:3804-4745(+)